MISSGSITFSKFKKSLKKEGYLFQKLSCSTELEIRTLYVSPEFANSVSGSSVRGSFLPIFALTPTVREPTPYKPGVFSWASSP